MGTPDFAVASLDALVNNNFEIAGVVTSPDRPAGRGRKIQESAVKRYANEKDLTILQPSNLKSENFLEKLEALKPDLQVVVAFRMLPEVVWSKPSLGTFNLHASLLPQYRGAAPINWAIINGEKETGVTTFLIDKEIDTGKILFREKTDIGKDETAGELHDRLMRTGAKLVLKTVKAIETGNIQYTEQDELARHETVLKKAPKIFREDCSINWDNSVDNLHNFIRGLSPFPAAYTELPIGGKKEVVKIFSACKTSNTYNANPGEMASDGKSYLRIAAKDGWIELLELQRAGKRKMKIVEFLRGLS